MKPSARIVLVVGSLLAPLAGQQTQQGTRRESPVLSSPATRFVVERFPENPIIRPGLSGFAKGEDGNINGPSLIRVPEWIDKPLGLYYLYFAHHGGKDIRLAYADRLEGPWKVHPGGVLAAADGPGQGHIASPDVHVDAERKRLRMYFHQPLHPGAARKGQGTFVALSSDGLHFGPREELLGAPYFRVFCYGGWHYAFAMDSTAGGLVYRSKDGLSGFEPGPRFVPKVRHNAVWPEGATLHLFYSKVGEAPERLYHATVDLTQDWRDWQVADEQVLLEPETDYEGARLPLVPSNYGAAERAVRQLRDPAIFEDQGQRDLPATRAVAARRLYLLYSVAGERGIAIARLLPAGGATAASRPAR